MEVGERFSIDGYDIVASAKVAEGGEEVIVLSNNWDWFLVAFRASDANEAVLIASFNYGTDLSLPYRNALHEMVRRAMEN